MGRCIDSWVNNLRTERIPYGSLPVILSEMDTTKKILFGLTLVTYEATKRRFRVGSEVSVRVRIRRAKNCVFIAIRRFEVPTTLRIVLGLGPVHVCRSGPTRGMNMCQRDFMKPDKGNVPKKPIVKPDNIPAGRAFSCLSLRLAVGAFLWDVVSSGLR